MDASAAVQRAPDLVLARMHLRLGSLALARAELETLAGRDALDEDGLVDLAEARWRTGDIAGAGEAAVAALTDEEGPLLALIVAAEAATARGRPTEARRLAAKAMAEASGSIDAIFAGMPRGPSWPPDASAPPPAPTTMFDVPRGGTVARRPGPRRARPAPPALDAVPIDEPEDLAPSEAADAGTAGLWAEDGRDGEDGRDAEGGLEGATSPATTDVLTAALAAEAEAEAEADLADADDQPGAADELERGRAALAANDPGEAAVRLGLVLRLSPPLAPAVLDLVADRPEPGLAMVRGDAYRLVGREIDARRAFSEAARAVRARPAATPDDSPPEGDPA